MENSKILNVLSDAVENIFGFFPERIIQLSVNYSGSVYEIGAGKTRIIAKVLHVKNLCSAYELNKESLIAYIRFQHHMVELISKVICVPKIITFNGTTVNDKENLLFYFQEYIEGEVKSIEYISLEDRLKIPEILATIHQYPLGEENLLYWKIKERFFENIWNLFLSENMIDPILNLSYSIFNDKKINDFILNVSVNLKPENLFKDQLNLVFSHTDIKPKNIIWKNSETPFLIDWEDVSMISQGTDIVDTITSWTLNKEQGAYTFNKNEATKFIEKYKAFYKREIHINELDIFCCAAKWMFWISTCIQNNRFEESVEGCHMLKLLNDNKNIIQQMI